MGAGEGYDFGALIDDSQVAITERTSTTPSQRVRAR